MCKNLIITLSILFVIAKCQQTYDETLAKKLVGFSFLAYCTNSNIPLNNCGQACEQNPQGLKSYIEVYNEDTSARAITGYSPDSNAIIISFRGTMNVENWMSDFNIDKVDYSACSHCEVHSGFYDYFQSIKSQITSAFQILKLQYPNAKVYITGHSLGAAVATLALPHIYQLNGNKKIDVFYNFSSPRVGNEEFSSWLKQQNFAVQFNRITHGRDPVIQSPSSKFPLKYYHAQNEVYYEDFRQPNYTYKLCPVAEDKSCSLSNKISLEVSDHSYLFWDNSSESEFCSL